MNQIITCWWQILLASLAYFMIGAIWFQPKVLGTLWMKAHKLPPPSDENKKKMPLMMLTTLGYTVLICAALCYFLGATTECCPESEWHSMKLLFHGFYVALLLSVVTAGGSIAMAYTYQSKPLMAYITDIGYHVLGSLAAVVVFHFTCHCC